MFTLRFDMRRFDGPTHVSDLYDTAIEMCAWAETRGAVAVVLSEHHHTADDHLAAPNILAAAIAARTTRIGILLAAVPIPLWDPVRLSEEIAALDVISRGRVSYVFGIGHREEEYDHFGVDWRSRGAQADERLSTVLSLIRDGSADVDGRRVRLTPPCVTPGGPTVFGAGGSAAGARRAARHGLGFISQSPAPELRVVYQTECRRVGHPVGAMQFPGQDAPTAVFVSDDVEQGWAELGGYLLADARAAAGYRPGENSVASISRAASVAELRRAEGPYRIITSAAAETAMRSGEALPLLPLCAGMPPDVGWSYLENAAAAADFDPPDRHRWERT